MIYRLRQIWIDIVILNDEWQSSPETPASIQSVNTPEKPIDLNPLFFVWEGPH